jgi:hypothetical protein
MKDFPKFGQFLKTRAPLLAAAVGTSAGIVGAARVGGNPSQDVGGISPRAARQRG